MKALITVVITSLIGFSALANDFAAVLGMRSNSADLVNSTGGLSVATKTGIGAGVLGFFDMGDGMQVRSGFMYNQRNIGIDSPLGEIDANLAYVDIPVTAMFKFADYAGAFVGPVLGLLASKECKISNGTCTLTKDPESMILALQFGASFKFAPQMGAELYYEMIPSEYWKDGFKNGRTVGVNLLLTFE